MSMIRLTPIAFNNHMRARTNSYKPWCLHIADTFSVWEFEDKKEAKKAFGQFIADNEYYNYGIYTDGDTRIAIVNPTDGMA